MRRRFLKSPALLAATSAEVFPAVHGTTFHRPEGDLCRLAAGRTDRVIHLTVAAAAVREGPRAAGISVVFCAEDGSVAGRLEGHLDGDAALRAGGVKELTPLCILLIHWS